MTRRSALPHLQQRAGRQQRAGLRRHDAGGRLLEGRHLVAWCLKYRLDARNIVCVGCGTSVASCFAEDLNGRSCSLRVFPGFGFQRYRRNSLTGGTSGGESGSCQKKRERVAHFLSSRKTSAHSQKLEVFETVREVRTRWQSPSPRKTPSGTQAKSTSAGESRTSCSGTPSLSASLCTTQLVYAVTSPP